MTPDAWSPESLSIPKGWARTREVKAGLQTERRVRQSLLHDPHGRFIEYAPSESRKLVASISEEINFAFIDPNTKVLQMHLQSYARVGLSFSSNDCEKLRWWAHL